ncbi:MAG TPA: hypothetical protein VGG19_19045 [Tepidisphaeraceae bacterium]|jgi:hypothetical protein
MAIRTQEQEQKMNERRSPYERYKKDKLWPIVNKAVGALVRNGDLAEKTDRTYIVGYLVQLLRESSALEESNSSKHQRIIEVKPDEELLVRSA